ncbi:MAG: anion permease [Bacteroidales bacterium]|nr:anion permease [Bacteroidales bacterium]
MSLEAIFVLCVIVAMLAVLATDRMRPGLTLLLVAIIFMTFGIISPKEMIQGFSNKGMITVAILFLVSEGVRRSGALDYLIKLILPQKKSSVFATQVRMLPIVAVLSSLLNNTAIVVIFAPIVKKWAEFYKMPVKKFLIPLSYATILGGTCTLIGTSTNLVVAGMMDQDGYTMKMFEISHIGIITLIIGLLYIFATSKRWLPNEKEISNRSKDNETKEFYFEFAINTNSPFIGSNVINGHSNLLAQNDIAAIKRNNEFIDISEKEITLEEGDTLLISGRSIHIENLTKTEGITLTSIKDADPDFIKKAEKVVEVVLAPRFPGLRKTLKEFNFQRRYGAAIIAIKKDGKTITSGFEDVKFEEGDDLLLLTDNSFIGAWGESSVFHLMSDVSDYEAPMKKNRKWAALIILILMVAGATCGEYLPRLNGMKLDMFFFASLALFAMTLFKLYPAKKYTKFVSWDVLIAIASAFAISSAMQNSGIADSIANTLINISGSLGPVGMIAALYFVTAIITEFITNNAAAALAYPVALSMANNLGIDPMPFFITICMAASASFSTPIGYQTNLIVQSIGGYKFMDFMKIGVPLSIICLIITTIFVPLIYWGSLTNIPVNLP